MDNKSAESAAYVSDGRKPIEKNEIREILDEYVAKYESLEFIENDPILIPHEYSLLQDIEITAFWTSMLAWGQRKTIINNARKLFNLMDNAPYEFITQHTEQDRARFKRFVHRTFQATDALYFLEFFQNYYKTHHSLEEAFTSGMKSDDTHTENALLNFHKTFFDSDFAPHRTRKHVSTPPKSTCKRLNMFLRWMVRDSKRGVDFGLWKNIGSHQLLIPLDVHVERTARELGLLTTPQRNWKSVLELTENLRQFDGVDPVKYDFALFGLSLNKMSL